MLNVQHEIQDAFFLRTLDNFYNPDDDEGMAEMLMGTYIYNAAATQYCRDMVGTMEGQERRDSLNLMNQLARANLETVAQKLGNRSIACEALSQSNDPIRHYGYAAVPSATGIPNLMPLPKRTVLAPPRSYDDLRLYRPPIRSSQKNEFWDVRMASQDGQPLVKVSIIPQPSFMRRMLNSLPDITPGFLSF